MNKIIFFSITLLFVVGCGSEDSKGDSNMALGTQYTVSSGDKVIKHTENTLIKIRHVSGKDTSTIELVEGNATIIYKK